MAIVHSWVSSVTIGFDMHGEITGLSAVPASALVNNSEDLAVIEGVAVSPGAGYEISEAQLDGILGGTSALAASLASARSAVEAVRGELREARARMEQLEAANAAMQADLDERSAALADAHSKLATAAQSGRVASPAIASQSLGNNAAGASEGGIEAREVA
jgi:hypothetical protein